MNPDSNPLFECDAFELANSLLDKAVGEPLRPDDFERYHFLQDEPLGRGSMGEVWLAEEEGADRLVAIKFLRNAVDPGAWARREVKRLGKLQHQFIAVLYNHGVLEDGTPWMAVEYVKGARLDTYCANETLSTRQRLSLFEKVCQGVRYAHSRGLIHGDLKPSNILISESGEPKLVDFGLSEQYQSPDNTAMPSPTPLGFTPAYAAPEQFRSEPVSTAVDVYALGVILYELLTGSSGERPDASSARARLVRPGGRAGHESNLTGAGLSGAGLSGAEWRDLDAICFKAMEANPIARYETVQELLHDLDAIRACEPLNARQPHAWTYLLGKFVRRNQKAVVVASGVFVTIAGLVAIFTQGLSAERNRALDAAARTRRIQRFMEQLFTAGDSQAGPSRQVTMVSALDRAARLAGALDSDPEAQSELYQTIGSMYDHLGRYADAERILQMGVDKARLVPGNRDLLSGAQIQLGLLRSDQAKYPEAERSIREALATIQRTHRRPGDGLLLNAQAALGKVLEESGAHDQAIALLEPIVARQAEREVDQVTLLESLTALAVAHHYAGHADRADALNRRALQLDRRNAAHPRVALDLANLATTRVMLGKFDEAESLYREAAQIEEAWYGPDHPDTVQLRSLIAMAVLQAGRLVEAESLLRSVLSQQERAYETKLHPNIAFTHDVLAKLAIRQGSLAAAEGEYRQAVDIDKQLFGAGNYQTAVETGNLADVLVKEGQYGRAEQTIRPTVAVLTQKPRPGDPAVGISQGVLGRALLRQQRFEDAQAPLLAAYESLKAEPRQYLVRLQEARMDLAEVYEALHEPGKAATLREEWKAAAESRRR